ncbi:MAG: DNA cytosine methyltransferase [Solirubrobacterales bacterium]
MVISTEGATLRAVSLFSGAGGMDVGVSAASFEILACLEIDPHCCDTLRANAERLSGPKIIEGDIRAVDPNALMGELNLEPGDLDLLCGGPPCQSFSQIGKRGSLCDDRGLLVFEMVRFAAALRPKAILMEQVKGLKTAKDLLDKRGGVFERLLDSFAEIGYSVSWRVLNSAAYGVPQTRERLFIVALSEEGGDDEVPLRFDFPEPTHCPVDGADELLPGCDPYRTLGEALVDLKEPPRKNGTIPEDSHVDITPAGDLRRIRGVPEGKWLSGQLHLPIEQRGRLSRKDTTKFRRLDREKPSLTLRCGEIFFHPLEDRYLTPHEYLRLHGYPKDYVLCGPIRGRSGQVRNLDQHRQVANSVPPPLARVLAEGIRSSLTWGASMRSLAIQR